MPAVVDRRSPDIGFDPHGEKPTGNNAHPIKIYRAPEVSRCTDFRIGSCSSFCNPLQKGSERTFERDSLLAKLASYATPVPQQIGTGLEIAAVIL